MKINSQNYESYCLLYIDNELSFEERKELEQFTKENPVCENELNILAETKLAAEVIVYENKTLLYRHEAMEASLPIAFKKSLYREEAKVTNGFFTRNRVLSMSAIAALFLLFIGYRFYFNAETIGNKALSQNKGQGKYKKLQNEIQLAQTHIGAMAPALIENNLIVMHKSEATTAAADDKLFTNNNLPLTNETNFIEQETNVIKNTSEASVILSNTIAAENAIVSTPETFTAPSNENANVNTANANNSNEDQEAYNNINTEDHERGIYIANFEIDGDKLRGFSRRINAILKRNKNEKQK